MLETNPEIISAPRAWVEISTDALRHNLQVAKKQSLGCEIMAVVKAGAYGHGLEKIASFFESEGVSFLGVANIGEARRIRQAGVQTRIYILGATWFGEREEIVANDITACISTLEEAVDFNRIAERLGCVYRAHVSIDTGMGRGGFLPHQWTGLMEQLAAFPHLMIEGVGSHLPSADEDEEFTKKQFQLFEQGVSMLGGKDHFRYIHLSNSAGILGYSNKGSTNLVRPGLMLYGIAPMESFQNQLHRVMTLKSRITLIRDLPAGHGVSYGRSYVTPKPMTVATVGVGYGDGYPRHISGHGGAVWVQGKRCEILGRVTMDQLMIDATDLLDLKVGVEVELFGNHMPIQEVAEKSQTITWEILTGITQRVVRMYC